MNLSYNALMVHMSILKGRLADIVLKTEDRTIKSENTVFKIKYFVASYPVLDRDDEPEYDSDNGRECCERVVLLDKNHCSTGHLYDVFATDLREYFSSLKDNSQKELAIGSTFNVYYKSTIYNIIVGQYDLRLLPNATATRDALIRYLTREHGYLLSTGASFHVLAKTQIDGKVPMLQPDAGLLDNVWDVISTANGFSYLRVTHNVKSEIQLLHGKIY